MDTLMIMNKLLLLCAIWSSSVAAAQSPVIDPLQPDSFALAPAMELRALMLQPQPTRAAESGTRIQPHPRAFFCRFDDALDRKRIPLRMRLGTLEEVNRKEQKPGW